jgi:hypothetical protein
MLVIIYAKLYPMYYKNLNESCTFVVFGTIVQIGPSGVIVNNSAILLNYPTFEGVFFMFSLIKQIQT